MSLKQLVDALDRRRAGVFGYLETLPESELTARNKGPPHSWHLRRLGTSNLQMS